MTWQNAQWRSVSLTDTEVQRIYCKCETLVIMESDGKHRHSDDTLHLLRDDDEWDLYKVDVLKSKSHHFGEQTGSFIQLELLSLLLKDMWDSQSFVSISYAPTETLIWGIVAVGFLSQLSEAEDCAGSEGENKRLSLICSSQNSIRKLHQQSRQWTQSVLHTLL